MRDSLNPARLLRLPSTLLPLTSLLLCSGCTVMSSDQWTWLWLAVPFLGFGLAGFVLIFYKRRSQIEAWDLRYAIQEPSAKRIILWTICIAGIIAAIFSIYNILLDMDFKQKGFNIGFWLLGTIIGVALAIFLGLRLAEPQSLPDEPRRR